MMKFDAAESDKYPRSRMIKFMDRMVPVCIFEPLNKIKEADTSEAEVALAKAVYSKLVSGETSRFRFAGNVATNQYFSPVSFNCEERGIVNTALKELPKIVRKITDKLGKDYEGKPVLQIYITATYGRYVGGVQLGGG